MTPHSPRLKNAALFGALLLLFASVALLARHRIDERSPRAPADWWKPPANAPPFIDPETLERAAVERRELANELAERRRGLIPIPRRLEGGTAVPQVAHAGQVRSMAWYGEDLVTGGDDGTVRLWRPASPAPQLLYAFPLGGPVTALAARWTSNRIAAFVDPDRLVELRGPHLDGERSRYVFHGERILEMAYADEGHHLVALAARPTDRQLRLAVLHYETRELTPLKRTVLAPTATARAAGLAPDGSSVAVLGDGLDGPTVEILRADDGAHQGSFPAMPPDPAGARTTVPPDARIAYGPDFIAVADGTTLRVWRIAMTATHMGASDRSRKSPPVVASPAATWPLGMTASAAPPLLAACAGAVLVQPAGGSGPLFAERRGDTWARVALDTPPRGHDPSAFACVDPATYAFGASNGSVRVRAGPTGGSIEGRVELLAAALGDGGGTVRAYRRAAGTPAEAATTAEIASLDLETLKVRRDTAPTAPIAADADADGIVFHADGALGFRYHDGRSGHVAAERPPLATALREGVLAALLADDATVDLLVLRAAEIERRPIPSWIGRDRLRVALGPAGDPVAVIGPGGFAAFERGGTGPALEFRSYAYRDAVADFSPDASAMAICTTTGVLEIWGMSSREPERTFTAFLSTVGTPTAIRYRDDGEMILVGSSRGAVFAFHGRTGNPLWSTLSHAGAVRTIAFDRAAERVLTAGDADLALIGTANGVVLATWVLIGSRGSLLTTPDGFHVAEGPDGRAAAGLRVPRPANDPRGAGVDLVAAGDPDFARMGAAVDALRVTLILGGARAAD